MGTGSVHGPLRKKITVHHLRAALVAALTLPAALLAAPALATPGGPCTDPEGVTVVVDATDLGGDVLIGCAIDPTTGTDALKLAGFSDVRDPSGFICAIDDQPNPCPEEFTGEYWSYWYAEDGTWQTYQEGSDTAAPVAGGVEGWRWGDGSTTPEYDLLPAVEPTESEPTEAEPTTQVAEDAAATTDSSTGLATPVLVGGAVALVVLVTLTIVLVRRRRA